jgi:hypothetical protein
MRVLWNDSRLRALALSRVAFSAAVGMFGSVILLFVSRDLGFSPGAQGMIYGIGGLTSLAAATGAARCRKRFGAGRSMIGGLVAGGLGVMLIAVAPRRGALALAMLVTQQIVSDPGWAIYTINETTMRQDIAPESVLGRVYRRRPLREPRGDAHRDHLGGRHRRPRRLTRRAGGRRLLHVRGGARLLSSCRQCGTAVSRLASNPAKPESPATSRPKETAAR